MYRKPLVWVVFVLVGIFAFSGISFSHAQEPANNDRVALAQTHSVMVGEVERSYELYAPASVGMGDSAPLVIALHPFGSSGRAWELLTGFDTAADENNFLVAYPNALDLLFDDGQIGAGWPPDWDEVDDVGFISALIDKVGADYDVSDVYLTGFDDGGNMGFRIACEIPERLTKVAIVGAQLWAYHRDNCPDDSAPVSILLVNGTADDHVPLEGRIVSLPGDVGRFEMLNAGYSLDFWREHNTCDSDSLFTIEETVLRMYETCADGTTAGMFLLDGVGHSWLKNGDYALNQFGIDTTAIVTDYFLGGSAWMDMQPDGSDLWDGFPRSYHVYVPENYTSDTSLPIVFALHGRPDNGAGFAYRMDMNRIAEEEGFVAVYPDGIDYGWNYTSDLPRYQTISDADDQEFLHLLLQDLEQDIAIDPSRVYVLGFSNGGFMTQRLICDRAEEYAAFAVIGATLVPEYVQLCEGRPPKPLIFFHGSADPSVPWGGTFQGRSMISHSVYDTIDFWAYHNFCIHSEFDNEIIPPSGLSPETSVHIIRYTECPPESPLVFYAILGGGHNIPGVPNRINASIALDVNMDIHAATVIWDFFKQFTLETE